MRGGSCTVGHAPRWANPRTPHATRARRERGIAEAGRKPSAGVCSHRFFSRARARGGPVGRSGQMASRASQEELDGDVAEESCPDGPHLQRQEQEASHLGWGGGRGPALARSEPLRGREERPPSGGPDAREFDERGRGHLLVWATEGALRRRRRPHRDLPLRAGPGSQDRHRGRHGPEAPRNRAVGLARSRRS